LFENPTGVFPTALIACFSCQLIGGHEGLSFGLGSYKIKVLVRIMTFERQR